MLITHFLSSARIRNSQYAARSPRLRFRRQTSKHFCHSRLGDKLRNFPLSHTERKPTRETRWRDKNDLVIKRLPLLESSRILFTEMPEKLFVSLALAHENRTQQKVSADKAGTKSVRHGKREREPVPSGYVVTFQRWVQFFRLNTNTPMREWRSRYYSKCWTRIKTTQSTKCGRKLAKRRITKAKWQCKKWNGLIFCRRARFVLFPFHYYCQCSTPSADENLPPHLRAKA